MTRKKVKLAFIANNSTRNATYKKRKKSLMKKVSELSTLCGIDACAIICGPDDSQPEVWPNTVGVQRVIMRFEQMPEMERSRKMVTQESFIRERIAKVNEQLNMQHKKNREKEITELMYNCLVGKGVQNLVLQDLNDLSWLIDQKLKEIYKKTEAMKIAPQLQVAPPPSEALQLPPPMPAAIDEMIPRRMREQEQRSAPQWFDEWMGNSSSANIS